MTSSTSSTLATDRAPVGPSSFGLGCVTVPSRPEVGTPALFALMASQHGVAATTQARAIGVSRSVERRLLREGAITLVLPGVLAAGGMRPTFLAQAMAATLRAGVVAISHGAAARLHRLAGFADHPVIDVLGTRGSHLDVRRPLVGHYSRRTFTEHVVAVGPIATTSIPLTVTQLAPALDADRLVDLVRSAIASGATPSSIRVVAEQWREGGRAGPGRLLELLATAPVRPVHGGNRSAATAPDGTSSFARYARA